MYRQGKGISMIVTLDQDLANTILEVQHVLKKNAIEIGSHTKWEELVRISTCKATNTPSFNIAGCQTGRFSSDSLETFVETAYAWRAADVHAAACRLEIRSDDPEEAEQTCQEKLSKLRIVLDKLKPHGILSVCKQQHHYQYNSPNSGRHSESSEVCLACLAGETC
jgi:hypothetical protein